MVFDTRFGDTHALDGNTAKVFLALHSPSDLPLDQRLNACLGDIAPGLRPERLDHALAALRQRSLSAGA